MENRINDCSFYPGGEVSSKLNYASQQLYNIVSLVEIVKDDIDRAKLKSNIAATLMQLNLLIKDYNYLNEEVKLKYESIGDKCETLIESINVFQKEIDRIIDRQNNFDDDM